MGAGKFSPAILTRTHGAVCEQRSRSATRQPARGPSLAYRCSKSSPIRFVPHEYSRHVPQYWLYVRESTVVPRPTPLPMAHGPHTPHNGPCPARPGPTLASAVTLRLCGSGPRRLWPCHAHGPRPSECHRRGIPEPLGTVCLSARDPPCRLPVQTPATGRGGSPATRSGALGIGGNRGGGCRSRPGVAAAQTA